MGIAQRAPFSRRAQYSPSVIFFICIKVLDAMLFFKEAFKPNLPVGMSVCQCLEKRRWAVLIEIDGTDK